MSISKKKIAWIIGIAVLVLAAGMFWSYAYKSLGSFCDRSDIATTPSPDGKKELITFMYNCGPTVGLSVHASVINSDEKIDTKANGNALRIDSNNGSAWPRDNEGRPIIKAVWNSPNSLALYYSSNSDVFYQKSEVDGVQITFAPLTQP